VISLNRFVTFARSAACGRVSTEPEGYSISKTVVAAQRNEGNLANGGRALPDDSGGASSRAVPAQRDGVEPPHSTTVPDARVSTSFDLLY
jgi:hypothetical protein